MVAKGQAAWKLRFYKDLETGAVPMRQWLDALLDEDEAKAVAVTEALKRVLAVHGTYVCESEWGKNLGDGLYEFRIRHPAPTIANMFALPGDAAARSDTSEKKAPKVPAAITLRIFFTTYGERVILLCSGFDKARDPHKGRQQREITAARRMVTKAHAGLRARLAEQKRR
ncbi:MAG TPA: hypothetical protein VMU65_04845 [Candidatus Saccharimonadales bacterium]|nr:hypothetical protein [Candidatus Saccharimonadales bacterium]